MESGNSTNNINNVSNDDVGSIDRLCPKDIIEEMTDIEHILTDKIEIVVKVDLQLTE